jgi:shikimate kinase
VKPDISSAVPVPSVRLVLVGMMGCGKSTVGRLVAERTGWPYSDNDEMVRRTSGREPADIRATDGEDALHALEVRALVEALRMPPPAVIGAAAWVVLDDTAVQALREAARVVWLRARPETLRVRIGSGAGRRQEATDPAWLARQAATRDPLYAGLADLIIDVDDLAADSVARRIIDWLGSSARPATS